VQELGLPIRPGRALPDPQLTSKLTSRVRSTSLMPGFMFDLMARGNARRSVAKPSCQQIAYRQYVSAVLGTAAAVEEELDRTLTLP